MKLSDFDRWWAELNARTDLHEWEKNQIYADMVNKKFKSSVPENPRRPVGGTTTRKETL